MQPFCLNCGIKNDLDATFQSHSIQNSLWNEQKCYQHNWNQIDFIHSICCYAILDQNLFHFTFIFSKIMGERQKLWENQSLIHSFIEVKERNKPNSSWFSSNPFFKSLLPEHFTVYSLYLVLSIVFLSIFNSIFRRFHVNLSCFLENLIFEIHFSLDFCPNFEFAADFLFWNFQVDWKFLPFLCFDQWKFGSLSQIHMIISIVKNIQINEHSLLFIMVNTHMKYKWLNHDIFVFYWCAFHVW